MLGWMGAKAGVETSLVPVADAGWLAGWRAEAGWPMLLPPLRIPGFCASGGDDAACLGMLAPMEQRYYELMGRWRWRSERTS